MESTNRRTIHIHKAKIQRLRRIEQAAPGESLVIAKAGKPLVKVLPLESPSKLKSVGFMADQLNIPNDFDRLGKEAIEQPLPRWKLLLALGSNRYCQSISHLAFYKNNFKKLVAMML